MWGAVLSTFYVLLWNPQNCHVSWVSLSPVYRGETEGEGETTRGKGLAPNNIVIGIQPNDESWYAEESLGPDSTQMEKNSDSNFLPLRPGIN